MKKRRFAILFAMLFMLSAFCSCSTDPAEEVKDSAEKEIVLSHAGYPEYTFEEACAEASVIVIGTITEAAETTVY